MSEDSGVEEGQLRAMPYGRQRQIRLRVVRVSGSMAVLEVEEGAGRGAHWMWSVDVVARATELVEEG